MKKLFLKKNKTVWNTKGEWYTTMWLERGKGGRRFNLSTRVATPGEVDRARLGR